MSRHDRCAAHSGMVLRDAAMAFPVTPSAIAQSRASRAHLQVVREQLTGSDEPRELVQVRRALAEQAASGIHDADLIEELRSANARRLLSDPELPLHEVSAMLGYTTESAFRRAFRRWEGTSPGRFRRQHVE